MDAKILCRESAHLLEKAARRWSNDGCTGFQLSRQSREELEGLLKGYDDFMRKTCYGYEGETRVQEDEFGLYGWVDLWCYCGA